MIKFIVDKYNANKTWAIKKSKCGHYTLEQFVCNQRVGSSRMGIKRIRKTLHWAGI
jgi:hypothetical protein